MEGTLSNTDVLRSLHITEQKDGLPPAGVILSPFRTRRQVQDQYNDFMESVFSTKPNKSYFLRDQADKRTKYLEQKIGMPRGDLE